MIEYREITAYEGAIVQAGDQYRIKTSKLWSEMESCYVGSYYNEQEFDFDGHEYRRPIAYSSDTKPIVDKLTELADLIMSEVACDNVGYSQCLAAASSVLDACANNESDGNQSTIKTYRYEIEDYNGVPPISGQTYLNFPSLTTEQQNAVENYAIAIVEGWKESTQDETQDFGYDDGEYLKYQTKKLVDFMSKNHPARSWGKNCFQVAIELLTEAYADIDAKGQDKPQEWNSYPKNKPESKGRYLCVDFDGDEAINMWPEDDWDLEMVSLWMEIPRHNIKSAEQLAAEKEEERRQEITQQIMDAVGYDREMSESDVGYIVDHLIDTGRLAGKEDV